MIDYILKLSAHLTDINRLNPLCEHSNFIVYACRCLYRVLLM